MKLKTQPQRALITKAILWDHKTHWQAVHIKVHSALCHSTPNQDSPYMEMQLLDCTLATTSWDFRIFITSTKSFRGTRFNSWHQSELLFWHMNLFWWSKLINVSLIETILWKFTHRYLCKCTLYVFLHFKIYKFGWLKVCLEYKILKTCCHTVFQKDTFLFDSLRKCELWVHD